MREQHHHHLTTWQAPIVEDIVQDGKAGLTEAIVTGPGWAILFYGWQYLGEGLTMGEVWDTMFTLSGTISWVGKQAQLSAKPVSLGDCWQLIVQAITGGPIELREPGHPHSISPASTPFNFCNQDLSLWPANFPVAAEQWEVPRLGPHPVHQEQGWVTQQGWDQGQTQWELCADPLQLPLLSSDHGFKNDRSSASTSSSVASMSEGLGGSRCPGCGWWPCREPRGYMKINLPGWRH